MIKRKNLLFLLALSFFLVCISGCLSKEEGGKEWNEPKSMMVISLLDEEIRIDTENEEVVIDLMLRDTDDLMVSFTRHITRADGTLKVILDDSEGFLMYNGTCNVTESDFGDITFSDGTKVSNVYRMQIPFSEIEKTPTDPDTQLWGEVYMEGSLEFSWDGKSLKRDLKETVIPDELMAS